MRDDSENEKVVLILGRGRQTVSDFMEYTFVFGEITFFEMVKQTNIYTYLGSQIPIESEVRSDREERFGEYLRQTEKPNLPNNFRD